MTHFHNSVRAGKWPTACTRVSESCQTCRFHDFPHCLQMNAGSLTSNRLLFRVTGVDLHLLAVYYNLTILFDALMDSAVDITVAYNRRFIPFSYVFIN